MSYLSDGLFSFYLMFLLLSILNKKILDIKLLVFLFKMLKERGIPSLCQLVNYGTCLFSTNSFPLLMTYPIQIAK